MVHAGVCLLRAGLQQIEKLLIVAENFLDRQHKPWRSQSIAPRMITNAMLKSIISPVTSTRVSTKGADEVAGSAPNRRKINGSIDPERDPQSTTPTSATPTVSATN